MDCRCSGLVEIAVLFLFHITLGSFVRQTLWNKVWNNIGNFKTKNWGCGWDHLRECVLLYCVTFLIRGHWQAKWRNLEEKAVTCFQVVHICFIWLISLGKGCWLTCSAIPWAPFSFPVSNPGACWVPRVCQGCQLLQQDSTSSRLGRQWEITQFCSLIVSSRLILMGSTYLPLFFLSPFTHLSALPGDFSLGLQSSPADMETRPYRHCSLSFHNCLRSNLSSFSISIYYLSLS